MENNLPLQEAKRNRYRRKEKSDYAGKKIISFKRQQNALRSVRRSCRIFQYRSYADTAAVRTVWIIRDRNSGLHYRCDYYTGQTGVNAGVEREMDLPGSSVSCPVSIYVKLCFIINKTPRV